MRAVLFNMKVTECELIENTCNIYEQRNMLPRHLSTAAAAAAQHCCRTNKTTKWFYYNGFITQAKSKHTHMHTQQWLPRDCGGVQEQREPMECKQREPRETNRTEVNRTYDWLTERAQAKERQRVWGGKDRERAVNAVWIETRTRQWQSPLSAMLLSSFNAFVAYCDLTASSVPLYLRLSLALCVVECMYVYVCVCVCVWTRAQFSFACAHLFLVVVVGICLQHSIKRGPPQRRRQRRRRQRPLGLSGDIYNKFICLYFS